MDVGDWQYVLLEVDNIIVLAALALLVLVVLLFPVSKHVRDATGAIGFTAVVTGAVVAIVMVAAAAPQWPMTSCSAETRGDSGHDVIEVRVRRRPPAARRPENPSRSKSRRQPWGRGGEWNPGVPAVATKPRRLPSTSAPSAPGSAS